MAETVTALGCRAESIDYRGIADPAARVEKLVRECECLEAPLVLVGSSMGGYVAAAAASRVGAAGLFLLAPAFELGGFGVPAPARPPAALEIVHGWRDDVVALEQTIRYASDWRATFHVVDGDHRLTENIDEINYYLARFIRRNARPET
ncbi:MAG TPA: alpha/beta fold hydrolase [Woeseiaceae bacterium]|jgi:alpha-beta hydrolase superfamily lysophospholipase|nr:alpha/beta fold hydrolase [Woeseiaceae bacterium]